MSKNVGKWIANDTITGNNIKFANEQSFRARNAANTSDLNLFKANSTDKLEFQTEPVYNGTPSGPTSLVNQQFVQDTILGIRDMKNAAQVATAVSLPANTPAGSQVGKTLTADANGALTVDGQLVQAGWRVLVKNEGSSSDGLYVVTQTGDGSNPWILTRATDADEDAEVTQGMSVDIVNGTVNGKTRWLLTSADPFTVDTDTPTFVEVPIANPQVQFKEEVFTLSALDISNGYVDLLNEAESESVIVFPDDGPVQRVTSDYTLSVVSLVTRITFAGDLSSTLANGDVLVVKYAHF